MSIRINRKDLRLYPNSKRVITRYYYPGADERAISIIKKVMALSDEDARFTFNQVLINFSQRHRNISKIFKKHFNNAKHNLNQLNLNPDDIPRKKALLIGSYFTMEYSIESAAFFNPSIIEAPDQTALGEGEKRIIISFRATGEGHISSIVFRSGVIDRNNNLILRPPGALVDIPEAVRRHIYNKKDFLNKLSEMNVQKEMISMVIDRLSDQFTYEELQDSINESMKNDDLSALQKKVVKDCDWLANSHYEFTFSLDTAISERVIFPISDKESSGIEDARFVRFIDENGSPTYYATYTANNGYTILPKLIETEDFYHFKIMPLNGEYAQNKGLALFPRKIDGKYAMVSRNDGVNNYIMFSDNIYYWNEAKMVQEPRYPWQFIQIGNCGSPVETEKGWLLLTHGVGPMRTYSLGVTLLDLNDPTKVLGQIDEPLIKPNDEEREGYVPNVIYSCGPIIHNNELIVPYAIADYASTFASLSLDELFDKLVYY